MQKDVASEKKIPASIFICLESLGFYHSTKKCPNTTTVVNEQ